MELRFHGHSVRDVGDNITRDIDDISSAMGALRTLGT